MWGDQTEKPGGGPGLRFHWKFSTACTGPFAGLPAPTGIAQASSLCTTCGSGQAREEAGTG
ncbi:hypothetical protein C6A77_01405 [Pseudomonas sp. AFG_SD02_1510_Pfu_092]|nr:hypothetical protein C6A77_01405 [Pseudomonas sp. AFG_SD02_1510_Pfu_092]